MIIKFVANFYRQLPKSMYIIILNVKSSNNVLSDCLCHDI